MIKHVCDICGNDIDLRNNDENVELFTAAISKKATIKNGLHLQLSVTLSFVQKSDQNSWGDFCRYCMIDLVNTLDDRPKVEEKTYVGPKT